MSEEGREIILEVTNQMGVHARPAAMIVRIANKYTGEIWVEKDGERVNGKSIMGIMMLAAGKERNSPSMQIARTRKVSAKR